MNTPLDALYSSNGFDVEIREENNEYYFDVVHLQSNKRYYSKINLPPNVTISNLIDSFEKNIFQIFEIDNNIEIVLIFNVNGNRQQESFILNETKSTSGQEILTNQKEVFNDLYQNFQFDDDNNNMNNSFDKDNNNKINNDNDFVVHDNLIINNNINNNNEKKLGAVKKIDDSKKDINLQLQDLQFNINDNDFFNKVINNMNDNYNKKIIIITITIIIAIIITIIIIKI